MPQVHAINRDNYKGILDACLVALSEVEQEYGITIRFGPSPSLALGGGMHTKLYFTMGTPPPMEHGEAPTSLRFQTEQQFAHAAFIKGVPPDWYGKELMIKGILYRVIGCTTNRARNVRNIISIQRLSDGQIFRAPSATVQSGIARMAGHTAPAPVTDD
jgi:hypothetical protein